jgi:hypothetical protein
LADKLKVFGVSEEKCDQIGEWFHDGYISKFLQWVNSKRKRTIKVHIDKYDTWGMYETLAVIIAPMLRQLKEEKRSCAYIDNKDVPLSLRHRGKNEPFEKTEAKWDYVLDEMIYSFNTLEKNALGIEDWEDKYYSGEVDFIPTEVEINGTMMNTLERGPNHTFTVDAEGMKKERDRIQNGFRLFGKYYWNLWD